MPPSELICHGSHYAFPQRVNLQTARSFSHDLIKDLDNGLTELNLDFSQTDRAYAEGMLPIISSLDAQRDHLTAVNLDLPQAPGLRSLFETRNWAHLLAPSRFTANERRHDSFLPARRFLDHKDLTDSITLAMDIVLQALELRRSVLSALEWSLNEVADNVLNHAACDTGGFLQVETLIPKNELAFTVSDAGRGILASLTSSGRHDLTQDTEAIGEAVKQGVTRDPSAGQGNGLAGSLRIASASGGSISIVSGLGYFSVYTDEESGELQDRVSHSSQRFHGTTVQVRIGLTRDFQLEDALALQDVPYYPDDIIDVRYTNEREDLEFRLADHSIGFGTRRAGRGVRTKIRNLLDAEPQKRMIVDCDGVPSISSSFADEVFGKLFAAMGPLAFSSRVQLIQMDELVRQLVDRAIVQRVAQETSTPQDTGLHAPGVTDATSDDGRLLLQLGEFLEDGQFEAAEAILKDVAPRRSGLANADSVRFRRLLVRYYNERGWDALERGNRTQGVRAFELASQVASRLYGGVQSLNDASVEQLADVLNLGEAISVEGDDQLREKLEQLTQPIAALIGQSLG